MLAPAGFCQEGQLEVIAPSRRHLDTAKVQQIFKLPKIFLKKEGHIGPEGSPTWQLDAAKVQIIFKPPKYFEKKMKKAARRQLCLNGENTKNGETINDFAVFIKISRSRYPISICRSTFVRACSVFGSVTVSTPCSTRAAILAFSTSSGKSSVCSNFV